MADDNDVRSEFGLDRPWFDVLRERMDRFADRDDLRGLIRYLRMAPASDREKKRELARFFQSDAGRNYDKEDKFNAYYNLLRERNSRQIG